MFCFQGKGELYTYWLMSEDKSVRQKRLYQVITPDILAMEKPYIEEPSLCRSNSRNQSYKAHKKDPNDNSSFLQLIRNSESSSSLRLKNKPSAAAGVNLTTRRYSNEVLATNAINVPALPRVRAPIGKANSVDCAERLPAIVVDKVLDDFEMHVRETDSLLPSTVEKVENGANDPAADGCQNDTERKVNNHQAVQFAISSVLNEIDTDETLI